MKWLFPLMLVKSQSFLKMNIFGNTKKLEISEFDILICDYLLRLFNAKSVILVWFLY